MDGQVATDKQEQGQEQKNTDIRIVDLPLNNKNDAFNTIVHFLNYAAKKGAFSIDESHKIYECIQMMCSVETTTPTNNSSSSNEIS